MKDIEKNTDISEENDGYFDDPHVYRRKSKKRMTAINVAVIAAVLLVNILFCFLASSNLWYCDLTKSRYKSDDNTLYRITDVCLSLIGDEAIPMIDSVNAERSIRGEEPIKLNIIFCTDPDYVESNSYLKYVWYTARALKKEFSEQIDIKYINMTDNPSAVQKYKVTSAANIYPSNVIIEFGTEYVVHSADSFFTVDTDCAEPWAYNGEKKLAASILSVTRAEAPICCVTTNHGELIYDAQGNLNEEYSTFIDVIEGAGYLVMPLDLEKEDIPENCRLILTFAPSEDFKAFGNLGENGVSEIEKLDRYLDEAYSFFYVCDRNTPKLENLDEYLEEWGISVSRVESASGEIDNYFVKDTDMNVDMGVGDSIIGNYSTIGIGSNMTKDLRSSGYPPKVVFGNSTAITPSEIYKKTYIAEDTEAGTPAFVTYSYSKNGVVRYMYDMFTTYDTARAEVGGETYELASSENLFKLMTLTQEMRQIQEDNYGYSSVNNASYVLALSSTDFVSDEVLNSSAYGNTDVLLSTLRGISREVIPVTIEFKPYYIYDVSESVMATVPVAAVVTCSVAIPLVAALAVGICVNVKRKNK